MTIPDKMKACVLMGPNQLEIKEMPTPQPGPQDVLIKVEATAVCGSDVSLVEVPWEAQPPYGSFIIGHNTPAPLQRSVKPWTNSRSVIGWRLKPAWGADAAATAASVRTRHA